MSRHGPILPKLQNSTDFITTGVGETLDVRQLPTKSYALCVTETGTTTSWTVVIEGSLDGVNFDTIISHTRASEGSGKTKWTGNVLYPCNYYRVKCTALVLGGGTKITAYVLGV